MNRILLFCALGALWGCRQAAELSGEAITLSYSTSESSKVGALTAGDEVAVFARIEGTETYFLEGEKFITGSDGKTLSKTPTSYYPEPKQAVHFYAYFPYHTGNFSVPTDQSTAAALKQADLCWANASSTPVATPVSLEFSHLFARLIVQTNEPTSKIACQVVPSGVLNAATAQFTLSGGKREVFTTGSELILPVQPLTRLVLTVANIEYVFEGSINLQAGQTTTLNLTLHPNTQTATLSGSSTTDWVASSQSGNIEQTVSNILTLHWANYVPQGTTPNKIILTINGTDYTVSSGITYANKTFTVPFASNQLRYPYTISKIAFSTIPLACNQLLGATIYKSGAQTVGIKDVPNAVLINGLWWATGNLIADGPNGCKIGVPGDYGLYFQFGSLVGWSGGTNGDGTGTALPALDKAVWPLEMGAGKPNFGWSNNNGSSADDRNTVVDQWFFNYNVAPYSTAGQDIRGFSGSFAGDKGSGTLGTGRYAKWGVGDPCTYYLGGTWRLPTTNEFVSLCNNQGGSGWLSWAAVGGSWTTSPTYGGNFASNRLFFPASGYRHYSHGSFDDHVTTYGTCWSSSVYSATYGCNLAFAQPGGVIPQNYNTRSYGFPVRCVAVS